MVDVNRALGASRQNVETSKGFTSERYQPIPIASLGTDTSAIYTATGQLDFIVRKLWVCNAGNAADALNLHLVAPGDGATGANAICSGLPLTAHQTLGLDAVTPLLIPPGYVLRAKCGGGTVTIGGWGTDIYGAGA